MLLLDDHLADAIRAVVGERFRGVLQKSFALARSLGDIVGGR